MLLGSEVDHGDEGSEVGDFDSFGSAKSYFVNTNLFPFPFLQVYSGLGFGGAIHSKNQKKRKGRRRKEEASYMHFGEATGGQVERAYNELR